MKWTAILLITLTLILAWLYLTIGGLVLAIALGTLGLVTLIIGVFSLGIWYAHQSIKLGAELATNAQNHNDQWDAAKMQSLSRFGGELVKLAKNQSTASEPSFPPMLEMGQDSPIGSGFVIQGIEDEDSLTHNGA